MTIMWNDANKILPEKDGDYLVVIKGAKNPCILFFSSDCGVFYDENLESYYNITHWRELPKMPCSDNICDYEIRDNDADLYRSHLRFLYLELGTILGLGRVITDSSIGEAICNSVYNIEGLLRDFDRS